MKLLGKVWLWHWFCYQGPQHLTWSKDLVNKTKCWTKTGQAVSSLFVATEWGRSLMKKRWTHVGLVPRRRDDMERQCKCWRNHRGNGFTHRLSSSGMKTSYQLLKSTAVCCMKLSFYNCWLINMLSSSGQNPVIAPLTHVFHLQDQT